MQAWEARFTIVDFVCFLSRYFNNTCSFFGYRHRAFNNNVITVNSFGVSNELLFHFLLSMVLTFYYFIVKYYYFIYY
jgi:hypothetical protein